MSERWKNLATRIEALTLRERVLLFATTVAACVFLVYFFGLGPMLTQQDALRAQILQQRNNIEGIDGEIGAKVAAAQVDPDATTRARVNAVRAETEQLALRLRAVQNGLVAPERMAPLVDAILRANGKLELVQMRTLPVEPVQGTGPPAAANAAIKDQGAPASLLYRHGLEVTVRGNYLDMIATMAALEAMPTQLFWGGAQLETETWPSSRLTLTLHTLSLDEKWMKL
jgi:MSHA biogenesis protein MshJ